MLSLSILNLINNSMLPKDTFNTINLWDSHEKFSIAILSDKNLKGKEEVTEDNKKNATESQDNLKSNLNKKVMTKKNKRKNKKNANDISKSTNKKLENKNELKIDFNFREEKDNE